jgi:ribosomal-protein-alanine N-acetyltransferase
MTAATLPVHWPPTMATGPSGQLWHWRAMVDADVDAVHDLEARAYAHPWSRANFADALRSGYVGMCLCSDAGDVCAHLVVMRGVDELHLLNITVEPTAQGQGMGAAMMRDLVAWSHAERAEALWLEVRQSNERARRLYTRCGFDTVGVRKGYYPAGREREDAVVMCLRLPVPPWAQSGA